VAHYTYLADSRRAVPKSLPRRGRAGMVLVRLKGRLVFICGFIQLPLLLKETPELEISFGAQGIHLDGFFKLALRLAAPSLRFVGLAQEQPRYGGGFSAGPKGPRLRAEGGGGFSRGGGGGGFSSPNAGAAASKNTIESCA